MDNYVNATKDYFMKIKSEDINFTKDLEDFKDGFDSTYGGKFMKFHLSDKPKSNLYTQMYECSPKMTSIAFMVYVSPGKAFIYSNYVVGEGLQIMRIYLELVGFSALGETNKDSLYYCEYHGRMSREERDRNKDFFNAKDNIRGNLCKVMMISPSGTEGIQLRDIRQENMLEPHWNEVRIQQMIGRGIRQCSHEDLPQDERIVDIYRYKVIKPAKIDLDDSFKLTTDEYIEDLAKAKDNLNTSFLDAMRESAVDCELFKAHNMLSSSYQCFNFSEDTLLAKHIGPAYKEDLKDDIKYDSGLWATNSRIERIKVITIQAVFQVGTSDEGPTYSAPDRYRYNPLTGMIYDYETNYLIGLVENINGIPNKLNKDTYIISDVIPIPEITPTENL